MLITREDIVQITEDAGFDPGGIVWDHVVDPAYRPEKKCLAILAERGDLAKFLITLGAWTQSQNYEIEDCDIFSEIKFQTVSGNPDGENLVIFPQVFILPTVEDDEFQTTEEVISKVLLHLAEGLPAELSIPRCRARVALLYVEHMYVLRADGLQMVATMLRELALGQLVELPMSGDRELWVPRLKMLADVILEDDSMDGEVASAPEN